LGKYQELIQKCNNIKDLEQIRIDIFGKKGALTNKFKELKLLNGDEKREKAKELNIIKEEFTRLIASKKEILEKKLG